MVCRNCNKEFEQQDKEIRCSNCDHIYIRKNKKCHGEGESTSRVGRWVK